MERDTEGTTIKTIMRLIKVLALMICIMIFLTGCQTSAIDDNPETPLAKGEIDDLFTSKINCPELIPNVIPIDVICTDYVDKGLLRIHYNGEPDAKLKLQVIKGDNQINYNLFGDGRIEDFSLQYGSGEYTARIMQHIEDTKYFAVEARTFTADINDEYNVYLHSIQNVDWDYDKLPIKDVRNIVSQSLSAIDGEELLPSCSIDVHQYITEHIKYDDAKTENLPFNYLPDIEKTYVDEKGICYDYASLLASMLRSMGIPAKLVKGYASYNPKVYHAWNEVYIDGEWVVLDPTQDAALGLSSTDSYQKSFDDYTKIYEY